MRQAYMLRDTVTSRVTLSRMTTDSGNIYQILERPWKNNNTNMSCIPSGNYTCRFIPSSASGKYKRVYHLVEVDARTGILIHQGNIVDHTLGCLIIGLRRGNLGGKPAVLSSITALRHLVKDLEEQTFKLHIWGNQHA